MELTNEFEVAVPVERAWAVLTDLERIAPCLPGAQLREVEGDEYRGAVKIKVGPITTSYDGAIRFTELDASAHHMVLKVEGRETRGQGNVAAVITASMSASGEGTKVVIATDLTISGKVAQFGRGVLADVSAKLLDQFVANLESTVLVQEGGDSPESVESQEGPRAGAAVPPSAAISQSEGAVDHAGLDAPAIETKPGTSVSGDEGSEVVRGSAREIRQINSEPVEPVDLLDVAGGSVARRALKPLVITGVAVAVALRFVRRRHR
jgi:carbon monoxide dehydrogenase subunit G